MSWLMVLNAFDMSRKIANVMSLGTTSRTATPSESFHAHPHVH